MATTWTNDPSTYTITTDCDTTGGTNIYYPTWEEDITTGISANVTYTIRDVIYSPPTRYEIVDNVVYMPQQPPIVVAPEEYQLKDAEAQRRQTQERRERERVRVIAAQKGERLLRDILGETDFTLFKKNGYVDILSLHDPGKKYRIRENRRIGIVRLEEGRWVEKALSLCIHPESAWQYVIGDLVATHVLLAKFDEPTLNKVANLHRMAA